jgi:hypothetical protein
MEFLQPWAVMAMVAAMVLMGRRSGSYECAIPNGEKLETELIKIPMVNLPSGATENHICLFGGFARTTSCACATTAVVAMRMTNTVTSAVAAVMVMVKLRTMATAAMVLVMAAMVARMTAVTVLVIANLGL